MEFREIIKIFNDRRKLFFGTVLFFILLGTALFVFQPERYAAELGLNVTRKGMQDTSDYRYDGFYRLQADEKFADTVVAWLGSARIVEDIYREAGVADKKSVQARRLSPQMISAVFVIEKKQDAENISKAALSVLNRQTEKLDEFQKDANWFVLVVDKPSVSPKKIGLFVALAASLLAGLFFGAWSVMLAYYLKK